MWTLLAKLITMYFAVFTITNFVSEHSSIGLIEFHSFTKEIFVSRLPTLLLGCQEGEEGSLANSTQLVDGKNNNVASKCVQNVSPIPFSLVNQTIGLTKEKISLNNSNEHFYNTTIILADYREVYETPYHLRQANIWHQFTCGLHRTDNEWNGTHNTLNNHEYVASVEDELKPDVEQTTYIDSLDKPMLENKLHDEDVHNYTELYNSKIHNHPNNTIVDDYCFTVAEIKNDNNIHPAFDHKIPSPSNLPINSDRSFDNTAIAVYQHTGGKNHKLRKLIQRFLKQMRHVGKYVLQILNITATKFVYQEHLDWVLGTGSEMLHDLMFNSGLSKKDLYFVFVVYVMAEIIFLDIKVKASELENQLAMDIVELKSELSTDEKDDRERNIISKLKDVMKRAMKLKDAQFDKVASISNKARKHRIDFPLKFADPPKEPRLPAQPTASPAHHYRYPPGMYNPVSTDYKYYTPNAPFYSSAGIYSPYSTRNPNPSTSTMDGEHVAFADSEGNARYDPGHGAGIC